MDTLERQVEALRGIPAFAELPPARSKLVAQAAEGVPSSSKKHHIVER